MPSFPLSTSSTSQSAPYPVSPILLSSTAPIVHVQLRSAPSTLHTPPSSAIFLLLSTCVLFLVSALILSTQLSTTAPSQISSTVVSSTIPPLQPTSFFSQPRLPAASSHILSFSLLSLALVSSLFLSTSVLIIPSVLLTSQYSSHFQSTMLVPSPSVSKSLRVAIAQPRSLSCPVYCYHRWLTSAGSDHSISVTLLLGLLSSSPS